MTLEQFIRDNRTELDAVINRTLNYVPREASCYCPKSRTEHYHESDRSLDEEDIEQWILNDEGLYGWAENAGVRFDEDGDEDDD